MTTATATANGGGADRGDGFDPGAHMVSLRGGAAYLPVSARKVWLQSRTDHALEAAYGYTILTEPHVINEGVAVFRAEVTITDDGGTVIRRATGYGSETPADFGDYIEKAETKAVGRALANCGFGTDNTDDEVVADAPRGGAGGPRPVPARGAAPGGGGDEPVTDRQWGMYQRLCRERGMTPQDRGGFTKRTMSGEIDRLMQTQPATAPASAPHDGAPDPDEPSW